MHHTQMKAKCYIMGAAGLKECEGIYYCQAVTTIPQQTWRTVTSPLRFFFLKLCKNIFALEFHRNSYTYITQATLAQRCDHRGLNAI